MRPLPRYLTTLMTYVNMSGDCPDEHVIDGPSADPELVIEGVPFLNFASPNYLGLSNDPKVNAAGIRAIKKYGMGVNGSPLLTGYVRPYRDLALGVAKFMGQEAARLWNSTTYASMDLIAALLDPPLVKFQPEFARERLPKRAVFLDAESHASLHDALRQLRGVDVYIYRHNDMARLRRLLARSHHLFKLIMTDGFFSVSGAVANLPVICDLADEFGGHVLIDDAHGVGVLGAHGRGTAELLGVEHKVDFIVGSLAKAMGVRLGFVAGPAELISYLRYQRRYMFSGSEPAAVPVAALAALNLMQKESWRRQTALARAEQLRSGLKAMGCMVLGEHHIVPWMIGRDRVAAAIAKELERAGIFSPAVLYPAAPRNEAVIRFMLMCSHTTEHVDHLLEVCAGIVARYQIKRLPAVV